jgi:hypothetical protein
VGRLVKGFLKACSRPLSCLFNGFSKDFNMPVRSLQKPFERPLKAVGKEEGGRERHGGFWEKRGGDQLEASEWSPAFKNPS